MIAEFRLVRPRPFVRLRRNGGRHCGDDIRRRNAWPETYKEMVPGRRVSVQLNRAVRANAGGDNLNRLMRRRAAGNDDRDLPARGVVGAERIRTALADDPYVAMNAVTSTGGTEVGVLGNRGKNYLRISGDSDKFNEINELRA